MASFRVPITRRVIDPDPVGPIRTILRASVGIQVRTRGGWYTPLPGCIVDTGASYTMMSVRRAKFLHLEVPAATSRVPLATASRSEPATVHDGEIVVRFPQLPGRTFRLSCVFVQNLPDTTPLLLGLRDFLDAFRVTFDGGFAPDAPAGHMHFETV